MTKRRIIALKHSAFFMAAASALVFVLQPASSSAAPLVTYITGDHLGVPVIYRAVFDPAVKDSGALSIVVYDPVLDAVGGRLDNIDIVPGSSFQRVVSTAQTAGDGALVHYNVITGARLTDFVASTNAVVPSPGTSRPASIVPNPTGTHFYYNENQFGFAGATHRLMRAPNGVGIAEVVYNGASNSLVEFSGVEFVGSDLYFFARDTTLGTPLTRQLYSVPISAVTGLASGPPVLRVGGLDRSSTVAVGPGPGTSDGSDELDYDPVTNRIYGTNIGTGEMIGYVPGSGSFASPALLPFYIDSALIDAAAAVTTNDGLGLLSGVVTPSGANPRRQIDGIRPDPTGQYLVVVGHDGVLVSVDIAGVIANGADSGDIIRIFANNVLTAGQVAPGLNRAAVDFDDHTLLAPVTSLPEPTSLAAWSMLAAAGLTAGVWRRFRKSARSYI